MSLQKQKISLFFIAAILTFTPFFVSAAGLVPCGGTTEKPCTVLDAFYGVARVTNWLIMVAGIFAVYQIVNNGFWLVVTMGDEEKITAHKKALTNVFVGFFLTVAAYMFVNTAVNGLLMSKCKINFSSPWTYITMTNPGSPDCRAAKEGEPGYNAANVQGGVVVPKK